MEIAKKEHVETHLSGFAKPTQLAFSTTLAGDYSSLSFYRGPGFKKSLTNPLKLADGRTVGQSERDSLHEKLDKWIEENLK